MEGCGAAWRHGPGAGGNDGLCMVVPMVMVMVMGRAATACDP